MITELEPANEDGPSVEDLDAIEVEWPLIAAEVELTNAQIRILAAQPQPTVLDWRRLRRAQARVLREAAALASRPADQVERLVA